MKLLLEVRTISFKLGDRVRVIKVGLDSYGLVGIVKSLEVENFPNSILVEFDCWKDGNQKTLYFNKKNLHKESEGNNIAKLTGFNKLASIVQVNGYEAKEYFYALYDDNICIGDKVLVTGSATGQIWTVSDVVDYDKFVNTNNITAEVICKVDTSDYDKRCANRKKAEELRKQMDKKRKEIEARKDDRYYAALDPEYAAMLEQMKSMVEGE